MGKVAIVTDTTASLPSELVHSYEVVTIPLLLHLDGNTYRDTVDMKTASELFQLVGESSHFPTTSAPPPGEYVKLYQQLGQQTDHIFVVTMSSNLSLTYGSATQARAMVKKELPEVNIEVFDSKTTVGAMGLIVLAAARAAAAGKDLAEITSIAEAVRSRVSYLFMMDTLTYLARSGRISKAKAMAGNMLSMKPITEILTSTGRPDVVTRPRTKKKAIEILLGLVEQRVPAGRKLRVLIDHTGLVEEAERLKAALMDRLDCAEILLCRYNPISSMIVGPGGVGLGFYLESEEKS